MFGGNTRVLMQFSDDSLEVYYILEIVNSARARVDIGGAARHRHCRGARRARTALEGSSPPATRHRARDHITGRFAPGTTLVQVAFRMPYSGDRADVAAGLAGRACSRSPSASRRSATSRSRRRSSRRCSDVTRRRRLVTCSAPAPALRPAARSTSTISNLPLHSPVPRYVALGLAGCSPARRLARRPAQRPRRHPPDARAAPRQLLAPARRKLESKRRAGTVDPRAITRRRQRLDGELERIYGELDEASTGPQGGGEGVAA